MRSNRICGGSRGAIALSLCVLLALGVSFAVFGAAGARAGDSPFLKDLSLNDAVRLLRENEGRPDFVIVDVRTPQEFMEGHLRDALNIDVSAKSFTEELKDLDRSKTYFVYCRSGSRSSRASRIMSDMGFERIYNFIEGGYSQLAARGVPSVR